MELGAVVGSSKDSQDGSLATCISQGETKVVKSHQFSQQVASATVALESPSIKALSRLIKSKN